MSNFSFLYNYPKGLLMQNEAFRALNISVVTEGQTVLKELSLSLNRGETIGVFSTFDSGITSLLDTVTGKIKLNSGVLYYNDIPYHSGGLNYPGARIAQVSMRSSLINRLKLWESILVVRKHRRANLFLNKSLIVRELEKRFAEFNLNFSPNQLTDSLTPIQHIIIDLLKVYLSNAQIILISNFSIECTKDEYLELFSFIDMLKRRGLSFIITSYRISNLKMCADKICFLTGGSIVKSIENHPDNDALINRILTSLFSDNKDVTNKQSVNKELIFQAKNIDIGLKKPISFDLKKGEIVAFVDPLRTSINILESKLRSVDRTCDFLLHGKPIKKFGWNKKVIFVDFNTKDMVFSRLSMIDNICFTSYSKYSFMGIIRRRLLKFISEEFFQWYGDDSPNKFPNKTTISRKERIAILLFRLRLSNPYVLFCTDPSIATDYINYKRIYNELADFAYHKGMAICILVSSTDSIYDFADRYIIASEKNIIEENKSKNPHNSVLNNKSKQYYLEIKE